MDEILEVIRRSPDVSRAQLVDLTGHPVSTVTHSLARLASQGLIDRSEPMAKGPGSGRGRPAAGFRARGRGNYLAAIDFGHDHLSVALGDENGAILAEARAEIDVDLNAEDSLDLAARELGKLLKWSGIQELSAVAAGIPGPINRRTGLVCSATILSSWVGLNPANELQRRIGAPVVVENDAALGALGELVLGSGRGYRDLVYIKASNGVGAGIVWGGQIYPGADGLAGEIGHTPLAGRTELCRCGSRGCLEAVVSTPALRDQINHTHPHLGDSDARLAELDDPVTRRLLGEAGRTLGDVVAIVCNLLNPARVIVGGDLGASGSSFVNGVRSSIVRNSQPAIAENISVVPAELGVRSELLGAMELARQCSAKQLAVTADDSARL